jgi:hypothetical protein
MTNVHIVHFLNHRALNKYGLTFSRAIDGEGNFTVTAFGMSGQKVGHLKWNPRSGRPLSSKIELGHRQVSKVGAIIGEAHNWAFAHNDLETSGPNYESLKIEDFYPKDEPPQKGEGSEYGTPEESQQAKVLTGGLPPYGTTYNRDYTEGLRARKTLPPTTRPERKQIPVPNAPRVS